MKHISVLLILFLVAWAYGIVPPDSEVAASCFPLTRIWGSGPNGISLEQWWCSADDYYGFLGFSYPVEDGCSSYSYNSFLSDFKNMKSKFNSTFVRVYLPVCTTTSFWVNMIKAARDASLAVIPMIFLGLGTE